MHCTLSRPNIFLDIHRAKGDHVALFSPLLEELLEKGRDTPKTIIFCRSVKDIKCFYQ